MTLTAGVTLAHYRITAAWARTASTRSGERMMAADVVTVLDSAGGESP
jgi:hypothetical protein